MPLLFSPPVPLPTALLPVDSLLRSLNYTPVCREEALSYVGRNGTAECCRAIDREDRAAVEALLPGNPLHWGPETDADRWGITNAG